MKKGTLIIALIFLLTSQAYAGSIFKKQETVEPDRTQPFFIKIYSDTNTDLEDDIERPELATSHQIHFYNKPFCLEENKTEGSFFINAKRTSEVDLNRNLVDKVALSSNRTFGKWNLEGSVYQETVFGKNTYGNYISFEPSYRINNNFSLFGGVSHSLTDNYDQTKLGIKWTPVKFNRLEFKLSVSNYTKQFYSYRNKLNFETVFKM